MYRPLQFLKESLGLGELVGFPLHFIHLKSFYEQMASQMNRRAVHLVVMVRNLLSQRS